MATYLIRSEDNVGSNPTTPTMKYLTLVSVFLCLAGCQQATTPVVVPPPPPQRNGVHITLTLCLAGCQQATTPAVAPPQRNGVRINVCPVCHGQNDPYCPICHPHK